MSVRKGGIVIAGSVASVKDDIDSLKANKANVDLSNLDATGQAKFDAKANVSNFQVVSELPAEPDANTFYFIPET